MIEENINEQTQEIISPKVNTDTKSINTNTDSLNMGVITDPNAIASIPTDETDTNVQAEPVPEVFVRYTHIGFFPKSITLEEGTTVTFTNESTGGVWATSDNHLSHSVLPEFDQKETVSAGGTYSYTFTKGGS